MKKLFLIIALAVMSVAMFAQATNAIVYPSGTLTVNGTGTASYTIPSNFERGYDYSYQVIPTLGGVSGDSLNVAIALWQSNSINGAVWTELTTVRDTATAATGNLVQGSDEQSYKHKLIFTGISTDTMTVKVYVVLKLINEN